MLGLTRSIFLLGVPVGILYLLWAFRPRTLALIPVSWRSRPTLPCRFRSVSVCESVVSPHGEMDSKHFSLGYAQDRLGNGESSSMVRHWSRNRSSPGSMPMCRPVIPRPLPPGWYGHLHNIYLQYAAE